MSVVEGPVVSSVVGGGMFDHERGVVAVRIRRVGDDEVHVRGIPCLVQVADQEPGEDLPPSRLALVLVALHDVD